MHAIFSFTSAYPKLGCSRSSQNFHLYMSIQHSQLMWNPLCSNPCWVIISPCPWHALSMCILRSLWLAESCFLLGSQNESAWIFFWSTGLTFEGFSRGREGRRLVGNEIPPNYFALASTSQRIFLQTFESGTAQLRKNFFKFFKVKCRFHKITLKVFCSIIFHVIGRFCRLKLCLS